MSPPPERPESHMCPFCGLAWTDTPATSQTNSLKATFWGHVLRDPPADPGEDTSGTFSLQSLVGGTDHQNAPRPLSAPVPLGKGLPADGTVGGPGKELVGSWEFKATEAKTALSFLQSLLEPNGAILTPSLFTSSKPLPFTDRLSQKPQAALFRSLRAQTRACHIQPVAAAGLGVLEGVWIYPDEPGGHAHSSNPILESKIRLSPPSWSAPGVCTGV